MRVLGDDERGEHDDVAVGVAVGSSVFSGAMNPSITAPAPA